MVSGFAGEDQEPVVGRMAGKIEQDIDLVGSNLLGQHFVIHADDVAPDGCNRLEASRSIIVNAVVVIADGCNMTTIQIFEGPDQKVAYRVVSEVGRDETQTQGSIAELRGRSRSDS